MLKGGDEIEKNNNKNLSGLRIKDRVRTDKKRKKKREKNKTQRSKCKDNKL